MANNIGYFTVNPQAGDGSVDWDWLAAQPAVGVDGVLERAGEELAERLFSPSVFHLGR